MTISTPTRPTPGPAVSGPVARIAAALLESYSRAELCATYGLEADSSDREIAVQAVLHGDANRDGSLN